MTKSNYLKKALLRLLKHSFIDKNTGCRVWTGSLNSKGYGSIGFSHGRKHGTMLAHRLSYMIGVGKIPGNLCVLHRCDNPRCINHEHLFLGTKQDNMTDMMTKRRHGTYRGHFGEKLKQCKISDKDALKIIRLHKEEGISQSELARRYKVSHQAVWYIVHERRSCKPWDLVV